jgi:hypothetical protein
MKCWVVIFFAVKVEGQSVQPGKVEFEILDNKSKRPTKRSTSGHVATE